MKTFEALFKSLIGPMGQLEEARFYTEKIIKNKEKSLGFKFIGETLTIFQVVNSDLFIILFIFVCII